jgi:6-phosphofructokinase 1
MPLQIYLAEAEHNLESLADNVNDLLKQAGRCIVVASEGFNVGSLGERHDGFGHIEYGASRSTVAQEIVNYLNDHGLAARGQATGQIPGVLQRGTSLHASQVDRNEAYEVGRHAVRTGLNDGTGFMATILRRPGETYRPHYDKVALEVVANSVRHLPLNWIADSGLDVTDDFVHYARPLIGDDHPAQALENGLQRFSRFDPKPVAKKLPAYVPVRHR